MSSRMIEELRSLKQDCFLFFERLGLMLVAGTLPSTCPLGVSMSHVSRQEMEIGLIKVQMIVKRINHTWTSRSIRINYTATVGCLSTV